MRDCVGIAEAPCEALVQRDVDDSFAADAVEHQQALDEHRFLLHQLPDAEGVERVPGVGRDLDAGADFAELRGLLEHQRAEAAARQRQRGGQAAEAAAGDDDRLCVARVQKRIAMPSSSASEFTRSTRLCAMRKGSGALFSRFRRCSTSAPQMRCFSFRYSISTSVEATRTPSAVSSTEMLLIWCTVLASG